VHDPFVAADEASVPIESDLNAILRAADAIVIFTGHSEYKHLDPLITRTLSGADHPVIIDGRNTIDPDSFINAIWWADVLGRMINNNVDVVNYFSLQSNNSIGGYGLFGRSEPRPTYYVYKLYKEFGSNQVFAGCDHPNLGIYAAADKAGKLSVILINLSDTPLIRPLTIVDEGLTVLSASRFDQENLLYEVAADQFEDLNAIEIPAYSITLLKFE